MVGRTKLGLAEKYLGGGWAVVASIVFGVLAGLAEALAAGDLTGAILKAILLGALNGLVASGGVKAFTATQKVAKA